ncbi:sensor histidine kinase [Sandaracinus amylolyticus]|uniref:sensor histidine kinase n=1 Tax=Sandaracinus amylolyticus TaxID=927083 RepID=UPI001F294881|nr:histidine kinase [Sandaracinus amylolyticus]
MWSELRALWSEPGPERRSERSWWDRILVVVLAAIAISEGLLRDDLAMRPLQIAFALTLVATLWFRRTYPLGAIAVAFGLSIAVSTAVLLLRSPAIEPYTGTCILLLPYSLLRWGSGREIAVGLAFLVAAYASSAMRGEIHGIGDAIGVAVVLLFPGALGASVRFRAAGHRRELEHTKLREREQLARELHDTVAHHVTAIVIQAQAGRAVLAARPDAAAKALQAIEGEATRTLAELRAIVGALRDDEAAALAPQGRIADIEQLARSTGASPTVEVELAGDLTGLRPSVESALYRLAQESITNAVKHARRASRIRVRVAAEGSVVRLTVCDDGETPSAHRNAGFGLVGMAERAALLGGTLEAGPSTAGGWRVDAALPRNGGVQ